MNSTSARRGITSTVAPGNVAAARIPGDSSAGSGVSIPARYAASNRKPAYPLSARRNDEQGTVVLRVLVQVDGSAGKVIIKQSSGYPLLDGSARSAVESWRFQPASRNNVAIAEWYQVAVPFTLNN